MFHFSESWQKAKPVLLIQYLDWVFRQKHLFLINKEKFKVEQHPSIISMIMNNNSLNNCWELTVYWIQVRGEDSS